MEVSDKAMAMVVKVGELQKEMSVAEMAREAEILGKIKEDLLSLAAATSMLPTVAQAVLTASREDLYNSSAALRGSLTRLSTHMEMCGIGAWCDREDRMISVVKLAAEAFVARASDYLDSKESFKTIFKED